LPERKKKGKGKKKASEEGGVNEKKEWAGREM
jgi:hypothetical protein